MIADSYHKCFVLNCQTVSLSDYTIFRSYQQWKELLQSLAKIWLVKFYILAILISVNLCFTTAVIHNLFIINDVEHLFTCLCANGISSLVMYLFRSFAHFFNWVIWFWFCFLLLSLRVFHIFYITVLYQIFVLQTFSPSLWLFFFIPLRVSFAQHFLISLKSNYWFFFLLSWIMLFML